MAEDSGEGLFGELWKKKIFIIKAFALSVAFWLVMLGLQNYVLSTEKFQDALLRSFSFSGAYLVALALLIGPLAVLLPKYNFIKYRRAIGVAGFFFALLHVIAVLAFRFNFNVMFLFRNLNPFANTLLFGFLAFLVFLLLFITSTEWATRKLRFNNWKNLHRIVYFGFVFLVLHFMLTRPPSLQNFMGYGLMLVSTLALLTQPLAFAMRVRRTGAFGRAAWAGLSIILIGAIMLTFAFFFRSIVAPK